MRACVALLLLVAGPAMAREAKVITPKKLDRPLARFTFAGQSVPQIDEVFPRSAQKVGKDQIAVKHTTFFGADHGHGEQQRREDVTIVRPNELMPVGVHRGLGGFEQTLSVMASPRGKLTTEYRSETTRKGPQLLVAAQHAVEIQSIEPGTDGVILKGLTYRMGSGDHKAFQIKVPNGAGKSTYDLGEVSSARVHLELDGTDPRALSVLH